MRATLGFAGLAVIAAVVVLVITATSSGVRDSTEQGLPSIDGTEPAAGAAEPAAAAAPAVHAATGAAGGGCPPKPSPPGARPPWTQQRVLESALQSGRPGCTRTVVAAVLKGDPRAPATLKGTEKLGREMQQLLLEHQSCLEAAGRGGACRHQALPEKERARCVAKALTYGPLLLAAARKQPCPDWLFRRCDELNPGADACKAICGALGGEGPTACTTAGAYQSVCEAVLNQDAARCAGGAPGKLCRSAVDEIGELAKGNPTTEGRWASSGALHGVGACQPLLEQAAGALCQRIDVFDLEALVAPVQDRDEAVTR